jgi:hypothetical protein
MRRSLLSVRDQSLGGCFAWCLLMPGGCGCDIDDIQIAARGSAWNRRMSKVAENVDDWRTFDDEYTLPRR